MTDKKQKQAFLEAFGEELMHHVRDVVFGQFLKILEGKIKSPRAVGLYQKIAHFTFEDKESLKDLTLDTIDSTLHHFLWLIEQGDAGESGVDLIQRTPDETFSLRDTSDGLGGELYCEDGWIARFSQYPASIE